eukprot:365733-Chlamydomonas_euryale.AAC.13
MHTHDMRAHVMALSNANLQETNDDREQQTDGAHRVQVVALRRARRAVGARDGAPDERPQGRRRDVGELVLVDADDRNGNGKHKELADACGAGCRAQRSFESLHADETACVAAKITP